MILTVTMNPSVDISYPLSTFKLNDINRVQQVSKTAGGKGLNVTRVIHQLGENVLATGIIGGTIGQYITDQLNQQEIKNDFLTINQESRNCIAILHEGKQTEILESGPTVSMEKEGKAFLEKFDNLLKKANIVTISGSLLKGLPEKFYLDMIKKSNEQNVPLILDTSGNALKKALEGSQSIFAIKPNIDELKQLLNIDLVPDNEALKEALKNKLFSTVELVLVSLGAHGAFAKFKDDFYAIRIPKINVVNPVGSGDATVAGLAAALDQKETIESSLKIAMVTGMLNTMEPGTGQINADLIEEYFQKVEIEKI